MFLIGSFTQDVLSVFGIMYPILMIVVFIYFLYTLITYKKRSFIDCIVILILFLAVLFITIQDFIYFYRPRTGDYYYSLYYDFPGILSFNKCWITSIEPLKYELTSTKILFDPTLITSIICIVISLIKNNKLIKLFNKK